MPKIIFITLGLLITTISCSRTPNEEPALPLDIDLASLRGEQLYRQNCMVCHQADGSGISGLHPPIWDDQRKHESPELFAWKIVWGTPGMQQRGLSHSDYKGRMPEFHFLDDSSLSHLIQYVFQNFVPEGFHPSREINQEWVEEIRAK